MKIAFCYPPIKDAPGTPLLSQNRQFQWYSNRLSSYTIYPVVAASAATLLKTKGHEVFWWDYISEKKSFEDFVDEFKRVKPDLAVFETKTPVIKKHWEIVSFLKRKFPKTKFVMMGDHVSAMPFETLRNSKTDFVLVGGDYDLLLKRLVSQVERKSSRQKIIRGEGLGDLDSLPMIDRNLTKWKLYAFNNGNYRYTPGAYTVAGRDCWWRRNGSPSTPSASLGTSLRLSSLGTKNQRFFGCTFCSWTGIYPKWRVVRPEKLLDEVGSLIELGVKEIFDDTGTFPVGQWLTKFCKGMIKRGYNKKIRFGCNARAGVLKQGDYNLMAMAGFRFILFGMESANNNTLERINKGFRIEELKNALMMAKKAGLSPHITVMFGYPWESEEDALRTVSYCRKLFEMGVIDSLQATILIAYPGTKLFEEAKSKKLLRFGNSWEKYDMRAGVLKCPISDERLKELVRETYLIFRSRKSLGRELRKVRGLSDVKYLILLGLKWLGKMGDFR